ncbi:hypothetical protein BSG1_16545 [Bacillus sp. SG-1]|nr:hypothetical protein BSG1_16545 [Bacillus sp. SG-1]
MDLILYPNENWRIRFFYREKDAAKTKRAIQVMELLFFSQPYFVNKGSIYFLF